MIREHERMYVIRKLSAEIGRVNQLKNDIKDTGIWGKTRPAAATDIQVGQWKYNNIRLQLADVRIRRASWMMSNISVTDPRTAEIARNLREWEFEMRWNTK